MQYVVPGMKLITQDKDMSCWYASALMLIEWRRSRTKSTEAAHPGPNQLSRWQDQYNDDIGIFNPQLEGFARDLGLRTVPAMTPTAGALQDWLRTYGPLWVNGARHITVIAGVRDQSGRLEVLVYDPDRPDRPFGEWRDFAAWYLGDSFSGRDVSSDTRVVFLYAPPI